MKDEQMHDLAAAYALNALGDDERRAFDAHLAECERCRQEVASLGAAAAALAYAQEGPVPPAELRERILVAAQAEPAKVVPLLRRRRVAAVAGLAAAACAALALGLWAALDSGGPGTQRVALEGASGELVVEEGGAARLTVHGLAPAPVGKAYEAWVIEGGKPLPAGLFAGGPDAVVFRLERSVPAGATVAVTLERAAGATKPTSPILFSARLSA